MGSVQNVLSHAQKTGSAVLSGTVTMAKGASKCASRVVSLTTDLSLNMFRLLGKYGYKYLSGVANFTKNNAMSFFRFSIKSFKVLTNFAGNHSALTLLFGVVSGAVITYGSNYLYNKFYNQPILEQSKITASV